MTLKKLAQSFIQKEKKRRERKKSKENKRKEWKEGNVRQQFQSNPLD